MNLNMFFSVSLLLELTSFITVYLHYVLSIYEYIFVIQVWTWRVICAGEIIKEVHGKTLPAVISKFLKILVDIYDFVCQQDQHLSKANTTTLLFKIN